MMPVVTGTHVRYDADEACYMVSTYIMWNGIEKVFTVRIKNEKPDQQPS